MFNNKSKDNFNKNSGCLDKSKIYKLAIQSTKSVSKQLVNSLKR